MSSFSTFHRPRPLAAIAATSAHSPHDWWPNRCENLFAGRFVENGQFAPIDRKASAHGAKATIPPSDRTIFRGGRRSRPHGLPPIAPSTLP